MESSAPKILADIEPEVAAGDARGGPAPVTPVTPAVRPVDIVVLTHHDELLLELKEAVPGRARIRPVDSAEAAVQLIGRTRRAQVLVVDTRGMGDVRGAVTLVRRQVPHVVVLLLAGADVEQAVIAAAGDLTPHAVLPLPIDPLATSLAFENAFSKAKRPAAGSAVIPPSPPPPPPAVLAPPRSLVITVPTAAPEPQARVTRSRRLAVACGVLVLGGAGAGAWWLLADGTSALTSAQRVETSLIAGKVDELLEKARRAMIERHFTSPSGDNALVYYRSTLVVDPANAEARDGLQRIATVLSARFGRDMQAGRLDDAATTLANLRLAQPGDARLPALERQVTPRLIARAEQSGQIERASGLVRQAEGSGVFEPAQISRWRAEIARLQEGARIGMLAARVTDRIRAGRLIDAAGDDARSFLEQLMVVAPEHPQTEHARQELTAAYLRKAREAAMARDLAARDRWLQEALHGGARVADVEAERRELDAHPAQDSQRLLAMFRERLREGRLTGPDPDSAAYYLARLKAQEPGNPALAQASRDLGARLLERARSFISQDKIAQADADLTQARAQGTTGRELSALQEIVASRPAAHPPAGGGGASADSKPRPKLVRYYPPDFPQMALDKRISGSVTVGFVIDVKGELRDVHVVQAAPADVFDHAAISAVRRWRYEPTLVGGKPVELSATQTVLFVPPAK